MSQGDLTDFLQDILVHEYWKVDVQVVWETVSEA
ncbi:HepT-like ribonuclease domain-containing protein [Roseofilum sp. Guam]